MLFFARYFPLLSLLLLFFLLLLLLLLNMFKSYLYGCKMGVQPYDKHRILSVDKSLSQPV